MLLLNQTEEFANTDYNILVGRRVFECWEVGSRAGWNFMRPQSKARYGGGVMEPGGQMMATNAKHSHT